MTAPCIELVGSAPAHVRQAVAAALTSAGYAVHTSLSSSSSQTHSALVVCVDVAAHSSLATLQARYDYRYVWPDGKGDDATADAAATLVTALQDAMLQPAAAASPARHDTRCFVSTRGGVPATSFLCAVREGLAKDGGLYMRHTLPRLPASLLHYICHAPALPYVEVAQLVLEQLLDASMSPSQLYPLVCAAYAPSRWCHLTDVCPLTPLLLPQQQEQQEQVQMSRVDNHDEDVWLLELYHGPTAAFKDFALQLFPRYFDVAVRAPSDAATATTTTDATGARDVAHDKYVILAATSGDTGVAAISGFVNARTNDDSNNNNSNATQVMVLYPLHGVSPVQQLQMLRYDDATRVRVYGVTADFDFCQRAVKTIFGDAALAQRLAAPPRPRAPVRLSSANSINWGRLIPQVAYYFWAYRQRAMHNATTAATATRSTWRAGDVVDVVVPCGNFGNILAAYVAKCMGLPLRRLVVASNVNDVLYEFVRTGCYDIRQRRLTPTASPSIDILKASNIERFVYVLSGGDAGLVASLMQQLDTHGYFALPPALCAQMQSTFAAGRCDERECAATIRDVFVASSRRRLLDPHTAVAVHVARQYRREQAVQHDDDDNNKNNNDNDTAALRVPLIVASTAHWAKFPEPVLRAIAHDEDDDDAAADAAATSSTPGHDGNGADASLLAHIVARVCAQYAAVRQRSRDVTVHPALAEALEAMTQAVTAAAASASTQPCVRALPADIAAVTRELEDFAA